MQRIFYSTTKRYLIRQSLIKYCANTDSKFFRISYRSFIKIDNYIN